MNCLNFGLNRIHTNERNIYEEYELVECIICRNVLLDPVKCSICQNHMCKRCISSCCENGLDYLEPDKNVVDELINLRFCCRNSSRGCKLGLSRIKLIKHEESCPQNKYCDNCCTVDLKPVEHQGFDSHTELLCVKEQIDTFARWTAKALQIIINIIQVHNPIISVVKDEAARLCDSRPLEALSTLSNMGGLKIIEKEALMNLELEFNRNKIKQDNKIELLKHDLNQTSNKLNTLVEKIENDKFDDKYHKIFKMCNNGHYLKITKSNQRKGRICDLCIKQIELQQDYQNCGQNCEQDWCIDCYKLIGIEKKSSQNQRNSKKIYKV